MKALIIVAHPDTNSFNHAIAKTCWKTLADGGRDIIVHDLYEKRFDPIIFNTSNTGTERENAVFGDPLEALWKKQIKITVLKIY
jgi:putative NADPH-quinone reductase